MKLQVRLSLILSAFALIAALGGIGGALANQVLISSKQIRNGSVKSVDLANGGVKSVDVKNGTVDSQDIANNGVASPDIEEGAVESEALDLPEPTQCHVAGSTKVNPPDTAFVKLADVCTYAKTTDESVLEVSWAGSVEGHNGGEASGCVFQLRVNGSPSSQGGGEAFGKGIASIAAVGLFPGLKAEPITVEIWARLALQGPGMGGNFDSCTLGPAAASTPQTIDVAEAVV